MVLMLCQCSNKTKVSDDPIQVVEASPQIESRTDTVSVLAHEIITQDFTDTLFKYSITHLPDSNLFIYKDLKYNRFKRRVSYDSLGVIQVTKWNKGIVAEKIFVQRNKNGEVEVVEKHKRINDSLQFSSKEKYGYINGLLSHLYFKDNEWVGTHKFERETLISYDYDTLDRKKLSIVKVKHNDRFMTSDSVKYFYKGDDNIPFEVHRKLEKGAKYLITKQSDTVLEIKTVLPDGERDYVQIDLFTFDEKGRGIEFMTDQRFEPQEYPLNPEKYVISYPDSTNAFYVPNLIFSFKSSFPINGINSYIESIVNPGAYRAIEIRTDLEYNYLPKMVVGYRSRDGINWKAQTKSILH